MKVGGIVRGFSELELGGVNLSCVVFDKLGDVALSRQN